MLTEIPGEEILLKPRVTFHSEPVEEYDAYNEGASTASSDIYDDEDPDEPYPIMVQEESSKFVSDDEFLKLTARLKNLGPEHTKQSIFDYFSTKADKVIVSEEIATKNKCKHWHIYCDVTDWINIDEARDDIRENFNITRSNKQYYLSEVRKDQECKSYVVKDEDYLVKGFTEAEVEMMVLLSYKKFDKATFAEELRKIDERWIQTRDDQGWIFDFCQLKHKYTQLINKNYVMQRLDSLKCRDIKYNVQLALEIYQGTLHREDIYDVKDKYRDEHRLLKRYDTLHKIKSKSLRNGESESDVRS